MKWKTKLRIYRCDAIVEQLGINPIDALYYFGFVKGRRESHILMEMCPDGSWCSLVVKEGKYYLEIAGRNIDGTRVEKLYALD